MLQKLLSFLLTSNISLVNDARLLTIATERMGHYDPATQISSKELDLQLGITEDDLAGFDKVEIECALVNKN